MMMGPGVSELVVMFAMLLSGGFGIPLGVPPEKEDPLLARVAPEQCVFYTTWSGMAAPDAGSGNRTERLLAEPEVRLLIAHLDRQLVQSVRMKLGNAPDAKSKLLVDAGPKLLKTILTRPTAMFLSEVQMGRAGPEVKGGIVINAGEDVAEMSALLERVQSAFLGDRVEAVTIRGSKFHRFQLDPRAPAITWGTHDKYLIVGIGNGAVKEILARAETAPPKWLIELRERLPVARRSSVSYVNIEKIVETFAPMGGPFAQPLIEELGVGNLSSLETVTGLDETGFVKRSLLRIDGKPQGALAALLSDPLTADDLKHIEHDAPFAVAFRLDMKRIFNAWLKTLSRLVPGIEAMMDREFERMEGELGFKLEDDLFKGLGDVWTLHAAPKDGGLLTGWTATVQVKDRKSIGKINALLLGKIRQEFENIPDFVGRRRRGRRRRGVPELRTMKFAGHDIHYLAVPEDEFPFSPAWCLTDKHVVFALFPQTLKGYLSRPKNVKSLAEVPSVARLLNDGDGPMAIAYYDSREVFKIAYPAVQMLLQMGANQMQRQGMNWDAGMLPSPGSIEKHLMPFSSAVRRTKSGVEFISRQTLPGGSMATSAPLAAVALVPAGMQAQKAARRAQSMNNLKQIGLAIHNFHDRYRAFPAAYNASKEGKPLLSWRVHILPLIGQRRLYGEFHLDEPWSSKHNRKLIARLPNVYRSPGSNSDPGKTVYLGNRGKKGIFVPPNEKPRPAGRGIIRGNKRDIVPRKRKVRKRVDGKKRAFVPRKRKVKKRVDGKKLDFVPRKGKVRNRDDVEKDVLVQRKKNTGNSVVPLGVRIRDIKDGTSNTILVVEASDDKAVIWTKPDDFEPEEKNPVNGLVGVRTGGFLACFCDGRARFISENVDRNTLRALFTKDGREPTGNFGRRVPQAPRALKRAF